MSLRRIIQAHLKVAGFFNHEGTKKAVWGRFLWKCREGQRNSMHRSPTIKAKVDFEKDRVLVSGFERAPQLSIIELTQNDPGDIFSKGTLSLRNRAGTLLAQNRRVLIPSRMSSGADIQKFVGTLYSEFIDLLSTLPVERVDPSKEMGQANLGKLLPLLAAALQKGGYQATVSSDQVQVSTDTMTYQVTTSGTTPFWTLTAKGYIKVDDHYLPTPPGVPPEQYISKNIKALVKQMSAEILAAIRKETEARETQDRDQQEEVLKQQQMEVEMAHREDVYQNPYIEQRGDGFEIFFWTPRKDLIWYGTGFKDPLSMDPRKAPENFERMSDAKHKIKSELLDFIRQWRTDQTHLILGW